MPWAQIRAHSKIFLPKNATIRRFSWAHVGQKSLILRVTYTENHDMVDQARREAVDSPTAWFAVLEAARLRDDHERAAEAIRQLRRLGVEVKFRRVGQAVDKGADHE